MKKTRTLIALLTLCVLATAHSQDLTLDFDPDRTGYGIRETTGTAVQLAISVNGVATAADNFDELDLLASATVAASGAELGSFDPFSFTMSASAGDVMDIQGDGIDINGGDFDPGETLTFIFGVDVLLTEFDFENIGTGELAQVSINGSVFTYGDSVGDSHSVTQNLSAGAPLVFQYADSTPAAYNLQGMSLSIVPEPGTYTLLAGVCAFCLVVWRKGRRH